MDSSGVVLGALVTVPGRKGYPVELKVELANQVGSASAAPVIEFTGTNIRNLQIDFQSYADAVLEWFSGCFRFSAGVQLECQLTRLDHYDILKPDGDSLTGALAMAIARLCAVNSIQPNIRGREKQLAALGTICSKRVAVCAKFDTKSNMAKLEPVGFAAEKIAALCQLSRAQLRACVIAADQPCDGVSPKMDKPGPHWFKVEGSSRLRVVKCTDLWNMIDTLHQIQSWSSIVDV